MVGKSVSDVPAMHQANLRIALKSSTQAALTTADMVLLEDSLTALPTIMKSGQRIVNGVLDTFKLYLSQISSQLLLIVIFILFSLDHFPYHPTQSGVVSLFTIALPNVLLVFWASTGRLDRSRMRRRLAHFIIPTAVALSLLSLIVYLVFLYQTRSEDYAQLAVTFALLAAGWLRILFVQPPTPFWVGGDELAGDKRVIWLVIGCALIFLAILSVPLFQSWMRITWLQSWTDYLINRFGYPDLDVGPAWSLAFPFVTSIY